MMHYEIAPVDHVATDIVEVASDGTRRVVARAVNREDAGTLVDLLNLALDAPLDIELTEEPTRMASAA